MNAKFRELLVTAAEQTERGQLPWTVFDSETFRAQIDPGYLHVYRTQWFDDATDESGAYYVVQVTDARGRVVFDIESEGGEVLDLCERLFQAARASALASDQVLDAMLFTLKNPPREITPISK